VSALPTLFVSDRRQETICKYYPVYLINGSPYGRHQNGYLLHRDGAIVLVDSGDLEDAETLPVSLWLAYLFLEFLRKSDAVQMDKVQLRKRIFNESKPRNDPKVSGRDFRQLTHHPFQVLSVKKLLLQIESPLKLDLKPRLGVMLPFRRHQSALQKLRALVFFFPENELISGLIFTVNLHFNRFLLHNALRQGDSNDLPATKSANLSLDHTAFWYGNHDLGHRRSYSSFL
jgi:hypothetical protein